MKRILVAMALLVTCGSAMALEPADAGLWHDPDHPGSGILLEYNAARAEFAVLWFDHDHSGDPIWFLSDGNCPVGAPCEVGMLSGTADWLGGDLELTDMGTLELERTPEGLHIDWTLLQLELADGTACGSMSPGGVIFHECVGSRTLEQLTSPRD